MLGVVNRGISLFIMSIFCFGAYAQTEPSAKVVVIPMGGDEHSKTLIIVAKSQGDFDNPVDAMASIKDAAADNLYRVFIEPGNYTLSSTLIVKPFVDVIGSGIGRTTLSGSINTFDRDASSALVVGADDSTISSLGIENRTASGTGYCFGLAAINSSPTFINVGASCNGAADNSGVYIEKANPDLRHVYAYGSNEGPAQFSQGIWVSDTGSVPILTNVTAVAGSALSVNSSYGLRCGDCTGMQVSYSTFEGGDAGVYSGVLGYSIYNSTLHGGAHGSVACSFCSDGVNNPLGPNCMVLIP